MWVAVAEIKEKAGKFSCSWWNNIRKKRSCINSNKNQQLNSRTACSWKYVRSHDHLWQT